MPLTEPAGKQIIPLFRRGGWYCSLDQVSVAAHAPATLSLTPEILLRDDIRRTREKLNSASALAPAVTARILQDAVELFAHGTVSVPPFGIQGPREFQSLLWQYLGFPEVLTEQWCSLLTRSLDAMFAQGNIRREEETVSLVSLPANTFVCLESCLKELLSAGACWIRPARREPFSAVRLTACLLAAGWPPDRLGIYGTDHATLSRLVQWTDRAILYGGPDIQSRFEGMQWVTVHGPGRAFAFVGPRCGIEEAVAWLKSLIASNAGRFCTNVGTIVCLHSADAIITSLAAELDRIEPDDRSWPLACRPDRSEAEAVLRHLYSSLRPRDSIATRRPILSEHRGRTLLSPALISIDRLKGHPLLGMEYPFPIAAAGAATAEDCAELSKAAGFRFERGM